MSELVMVIEGPEKDLCEIWRLVFDAIGAGRWRECGFKSEYIDLKMTPQELSVALGGKDE